MKKRAELSFQNASKRDTIMLGSVMIRIKHGGFEVFCDNASEAAELLRQMDKQNATNRTPWNGLRFANFIDSLGDKQRDLLKLLLSEKRVSAQVLSAFCGVDSNQRLAGVLSGISKQAAAHDIPARAVFGIDNEYTSGKAEKFYVAAQEFIEAAADSNWPGVTEE